MRRFALGAIAAVLLVGCTTSPPTPSSTVDAEQIIYTIVTELYCAAIDKQLQEPGTDSNGKPDIISYFASDDNWVVGIDLYLSASVEASVSPSISLLGPFNLAKAVPPGGTTGSYTSVFGGSFDQTRSNLREYKIYVFMKTLISGANIPERKYPIGVSSAAPTAARIRKAFTTRTRTSRARHAPSWSGDWV